MHTLYLASGSPRRREILENLGYNVIRLSADIDETPQHLESAAAYVARMAAEKNTAALLQWQAQHHHAPEYPILSTNKRSLASPRVLALFSASICLSNWAAACKAGASLTEVLML